MKAKQLNTTMKAIAAFTTSMLVASNALSQEAETYVLEELIVTAQKRSESIQDIPISITAFSDKQLNSLGIYETGDLGQFVSGLEIGNSSGEGSQLIFFLRGAGLNDFNTNNAGPVGLYSDEVYVSSPALSPFQLFDAERIEILKGPQGTIYGRNTTGGAIKFITKKPTRDTKIAGRWRIGNFGTNALEGSVSGALSDTVSGRVAVTKEDSDGFGTNQLDGSDTNGVDTGAYRGLLLIEPSDDLSILLNVHGAQVDSPGSSFSPLGTLDPTTGEVCSDELIAANRCVDLLGYRSPDNELEGNYNSINNISLKTTGAYAEINYDFNDLTFTSVTAYDELERSLPEESDGSPASILSIDYGVDSETFSQEFRLTGATSKMDWLAGAFYLEEDISQNQSIDLFRSFRAFTGGQADPSGSVTGAPILFARALNNQHLETAAAYGQASFQITDTLSATLGGRYTKETRDFDAIAQFEEPETFGPEPLPVYSFTGLKTSSDAFSYRAALEYKPSNTSLFYASVSRGFKSGGFNGGFLDLNLELAERQLEAYDPEFVTAYEVGYKSDFLDSRLRFNASVFYNDFKDLQVFSQVNNGSLPVLVLDNASNAESSGVEFDLAAILADGLTLSINAAFIDSELKDFISSDTGQNFSGNQIAQTPETSISSLLKYERGIFNGGMMTAQASVAYKDDLFFTTENNPLVGQEAYTLVNARLAYTTPSERWTFTAFVNNLTDERYKTNVSDIRDITASYVRTFGTPRTYGLEVAINF